MELCGCSNELDCGHPHQTFSVLFHTTWSPIKIMPRKKRNLGDYESVDFSGHILEPIPRDLSPELSDNGDDVSNSSELDFYNVCPCTRCAFLPKPSVRRMSTIQCHLNMHRMAEGGVHEVKLTYISCTPISHFLTHARWGWLVQGCVWDLQHP